MSDSPIQSTTPEDCVVIALTIESALLPGWFDALKTVAAGFVRRMAVIEKPDEWIVHCELPEADVQAFSEALQAAWTVWQGEADGSAG